MSRADKADQLVDSGAYDDALRLLAHPASARELAIRTRLLVFLGRHGEALHEIERGATRFPNSVELTVNRANALSYMGRHREALAIYLKLPASNATTEVMMNTATSMHRLRRHKEAATIFFNLAHQPDGDARQYSAGMAISDYIDDVDFEMVQRFRKEYVKHFYNNTFEAPVPEDLRLDRKLTIGYISADFTHHSLLSSYTPVLQYYDKAAFRTVLYISNPPNEYAMHCTLMADDAIGIQSVSAAKVCERIKADKIDILVDMSGHTLGNRMDVLSQKPAPIQIHGWGYGCGTGMPMIDWIFSDQWTIPPSARQWLTEKVWDLPCSIAFYPLVGLPPVLPQPVVQNGFVTFGYAGRYEKVSTAVEEVWARILLMVPDSRILFKCGYFDSDSRREEVIARWAELGVTENRLILHGSGSRTEHLATMSEIDIGLDPWPMGNGVTAWEMLWMGVPSVCKMGNNVGARVCGAVQHSVGLHDWVTANEEEYVALATTRNMGDVAKLRASMRERLLEGKASNPKYYAEEVFKAYRAMWRIYVESR